MSFVILTDTSANLPSELLEKRGITAVPFSYFVEGVELTCEDTRTFDGAAYYTMIQKGNHVTTAQINPQRYIEYMEPLLKEGKDILYIGMSSGISGAYQSAEMAAAELRDTYPERKVCVFDTYAASLGEGNMVMMAADARDAGEDLGAVLGKLHIWRERTYQGFTVDSLMHLRRSGRLSNAAAIVGTVLQIKPLLKGNEKGQIVAFQKVRGRKNAIAALAEKYDALVKDAAEQVVGIAHANAPAEAEELAKLLRRNNPPKEIRCVMYEPVTGAHVGPGTVALFFMGGMGVRSK